MVREELKTVHKKDFKYGRRGSGMGGLYCLGFFGTLIYFLHFHSGSFKLVLLAFIKALLWVGYLAYYALHYMKI